MLPPGSNRPGACARGAAGPGVVLPLELLLSTAVLEKMIIFPPPLDRYCHSSASKHSKSAQTYSGEERVLRFVGVRWFCEGVES